MKCRCSPTSTARCLPGCTLYVPHCSRFHFHPQVQISFLTRQERPMLGETVEEGPSLKWNTPPHFPPIPCKPPGGTCPRHRNGFEVWFETTTCSMYSCPVFCICALVSCRYSVPVRARYPASHKRSNSLPLSQIVAEHGYGQRHAGTCPVE